MNRHIQDILSCRTKIVIQDILRTNRKISLAITGGGTEIIGEFLKYGGGSSVFIDLSVPYHPNALSGYIKGKPDKACSEEAALAMAVAAYEKTIKLSGCHKEYALGVGATCKLVRAEGEREGRVHEIFVATHEYNQSSVIHLVLPIMDRLSQERITANLILYQVAEKCRALSNFDYKKLLNKSLIESTKLKSHCENRQDIVQVFSEEKPWTSINWSHNLTPKIIFPGSFNPLHHKHIEMINIASNITKSKVYLEIAISNIEKPNINYVNLKNRCEIIFEKLKHCEGFGDVIITKSPLFENKVDLFPNSTFVMGRDTYNRIVASKPNIAHYQNNNIRFIVFNRNVETINTDLKTEEFDQLCTFVSPNDYTDDGTSSKKIRTTTDRTI